MTYRQFATTAFTLTLSLALSACGDDAAPLADAGGDSTVGDTGTDTGAPPDAGDAGPDADDGGTGCTRITAGDWRLERADDVSVGYETTFSPAVESSTLKVLFERYTPGPDIGTFTLGEGPDGNFGSCAHCVHIELGPGRAFFADRGTLETRSDPYSQVLDMTLTDVRLVEVTVDPATRSSTPVEDGACVELEDVSVMGSFPAPGWTCDASLYGDGTACHCDCGAFDPDCATGGDCPPFDPGCTPSDPLPLADCGASEICGFDPLAMAPACTETCDWTSRDACSAGVCAPTFGATPVDACLTLSEQIDSALVGEACAPSFLQKVCNVVDGFAEGYCGPAGMCRPICESDDECASDGDTCRFFLLSRPVGYCGPEPVDG